LPELIRYVEVTTGARLIGTNNTSFYFNGDKKNNKTGGR
jgi:hypothetical protein